MDEDVDDEMLDLFRTETDEHLEELEQALLRLEDEPGDEAAIKAASRQTHNLKGAARILGFDGIERVAHAAEDLLQAALDRGRLGPSQGQALFEALDALRELTTAAVAGEETEVALDEVEAALHEAGDAVAKPPRGPADEGGEPGAEADEEEPVDPLERARAHRIETIRVDPHRLDALMRRAGELTATVRRLEATRTDVAEARQVAGDLSSTIHERLPSGTEATVSQALRRDVDRLADELETAGQELANEVGRLETLTGAIEDEVQASRLVPMATMFDLFARAVRELARSQGKEVDLTVEGGQVRADKRVVEHLKGPVMHLVRNAVDHGIEAPEEREQAGKAPTGRVRLAATRRPGSIVVEVEDDGRGIDTEAIREIARERGLVPADEAEALSEDELVELLFEAGVTSRETATGVSGRGIGLEAVARGVDELQGTVDVDAEQGGGTLVTIEVPVELSTIRIVLVCVGPYTFGVPVEQVVRIRTVAPEEIDRSGSTPTVGDDGDRIPVADIGACLGIERPRPREQPDKSPCLVLSDRAGRLGVLVDEIVGQRELVARPLGGPLQNLRAVTGASVLPDGDVCVILDPMHLAEAVRATGQVPQPTEDGDDGPRILLVEDTGLTRRQLRRRLEDAEFTVLEAPDGGVAMRRLADEPVDAIVTDILMPNVDGVELVRRVREDARLAEVPIVLVTTCDRREEAQQALDAGADAYVPKDTFEPSTLVNELEVLIA